MGPWTALLMHVRCILLRAVEGRDPSGSTVLRTCLLLTLSSFTLPGEADAAVMPHTGKDVAQAAAPPPAN